MQAAPDTLLSDRQVLLISRAIADATRFELFRQIAASGSVYCSELRNCVSISAPTVSHHLKELEAAGLITITREGRVMRLDLQTTIWQSFLAHLSTLTPKP